MTERIVTDPNGMQWLQHPYSDDHLGFAGHELAVRQIAAGLLPEGGTLLDVGAHVGLYSINLGRKAERVIAVEANPLTYETLLANIDMNAERVRASITAMCLAAWDSHTELKMVDENGLASGGSTHVHPVEDEEGDVLTTRARPLDDVLPSGFKPDLVKIDVEGAEGNVLRGMQRITRQCRPTFFIEMHDRVYGRPEIRDEVFEFLDFQKYDWDDSLTYMDGGCYYVVAKHRSRWTPKFEIETVKAGDSQ
jgi:FkbM family methyltransferase